LFNEVKLRNRLKVRIRNLNDLEIQVDNDQETVLSALQRNFVDWMHACGGKGRCTTCKAIVEEGLDEMSELSEAELKYKEKGLLGSNERLICQTRVLGNVIIVVPEENKLPHIQYT